MVFVFLFLTYFTLYDNLQVHPCCCKWHYFILFLWLSNIPLYICTSHASVNGYLGCFHVLAIVNSAAMNVGVHVSFQIIVLSGYMPRSGTAGSYGNPIFCFLRNLSMKQKQTHRYRGQTLSGCGGEWDREGLGVWGEQMQTSIQDG